MTVHVGDPIQLLGEEKETAPHVTGIFLHHDNCREPESLPYIDPNLFRTLVQDYNGVRVHLRLDSGEELSYGDLEQRLALHELDRGYEDGPELTR